MNISIQTPTPGCLYFVKYVEIETKDATRLFKIDRIESNARFFFAVFRVDQMRFRFIHVDVSEIGGPLRS